MHRRAVCQMPAADLPPRQLLPDADLHLRPPLPELEALTGLLLVASACRVQVTSCKEPRLRVRLWQRAPLQPPRLPVAASHSVQMLGRM